MIVLFTDFGVHGPYEGQVRAVLLRDAPGTPVVTLFADAPRFNPRASAYLLAAYAEEFPPGTVFLAVVDPGVGTAQRRPVVVEADGRWYVGPGNGLFQMVIQRARHARQWEILWRPERISASFHGRDLFAPVAAQLASGKLPDAQSLACQEAWPDDLAEVIYIDAFGNAMTGIRSVPSHSARLRLPDGRLIPYASTFGNVAPGTPFWYENANGLVEIAVNQGRADQALSIATGSPIDIV